MAHTYATVAQIGWFDHAIDGLNSHQNVLMYSAEGADSPTIAQGVADAVEALGEAKSRIARIADELRRVRAFNVCNAPSKEHVDG